MEEYSVYWIHLKSDSDIFLQGYIGKAKDIDSRWKRHRYHCVENDAKINKEPLYLAFRKHGIDNFVFEIVAKELDRESAHNLEYALRPCFGVGYNIGPGGTYSSVLKCSSLSKLRLSPNGLKGIAKYQNQVNRYYQKKANCIEAL